MPYTSVINLYHLPANQRSPTGLPDDVVYIGRKGHGFSGEWGNPFSEKDSGSRDACIDCYVDWLEERVNSGAISMERLASLHGKRLACFCKPRRCHGDVLMDAVDWAWGQLNK